MSWYSSPILWAMADCASASLTSHNSCAGPGSTGLGLPSNTQGANPALCKATLIWNFHTLKFSPLKGSLRCIKGLPVVAYPAILELAPPISELSAMLGQLWTSEGLGQILKFLDSSLGITSSELL
jgi:hypothetical protein